MTFTKAERTASSIKLAITGPSGSGKSYSALRLARGLCGATGRIAVIDTENGSAKLYSDLTEFYHLDLVPPFEYGKFISAIQEAEKAGFDCVIIDSASHLWQGVLDYKDSLDRKGGSSFTNWNQAGKQLNEVLQVILQSKMHVIVCLRVKQEYVLQTETNAKGKEVQVPKKIGLAPVMRDNIEYEFSTVLEVDMGHNATASKDRTGLFVDKTFRIDESTGEQIGRWLTGKPVNQEPADSTETFLKMIHDADTKDALNKIGLKIKSSTLPESQKDVIRDAYRERLGSLA